MAAERARPADLDHAQRRLAGLEEELYATLEATLRLTESGDHDAAIIRLDDQSRALDAAMDALARDLTGISLVAPPSRPRRRRTRWIAAALAAAIAVASGVALLTRDPLSGLSSKLEAADRTIDPQARLALIEAAYASLRAAPSEVVAASTVTKRLANAARRVATDLFESDAPRPMQQRAAIIARALDPKAPVPPRSGSGSPTEPVVRLIPRR